MAEPVKNSLLTTGYVGLKAGIVRSTHTNYKDMGLVVGGEANYRGAFLKGDVGIGTAVGANAQIGYNFDIGHNMGLELSTKASVSKSLIEPLELRMTNIVSTEQGTLVSDNVFSMPNGDYRIGGRAMLTYDSGKTKAGIGFEGGIHKDMSSSAILKTQVKDINGTDVTTIKQVYTSQPEVYGTPVGFIKTEISDHCSVGVDANIYNAKVTIEGHNLFTKKKQQPIEEVLPKQNQFLKDTEDISE